MRESSLADVEELFEMAQTVNFINLPPNRAKITQRIESSMRAFRATAASEHPPADDVRSSRAYMFTLEGLDDAHQGLAGTSSISAGMGDTENPNLSFQLVRVVRRSEDLAIREERPQGGVDYTFGEIDHVHAIMYRDMASPTELGGLLLKPEMRGAGRGKGGSRLRAPSYGKFLSWVRFHYIARNPNWFSETMLAEMMAPIDPYNDGNPFWRHVIRKFIGLSYQKADRLSTRKREFMYTLLPHQINLSLLPDEVLNCLGQVNEATVPARRMLEQVGFRFTQRIDPFDAGPHLEANRNEVTPIAATRPYRVGRVVEPAMLNEDARPLLVSTQRDGEGFQAAIAFGHATGDELEISSDAAIALAIEVGETIWATPFDLEPEMHAPAPLETLELPSIVEDDYHATIASLMARYQGRRADGNPLDGLPSYLTPMI